VKNFFLLSGILVLVGLSGCAGARKRNEAAFPSGEVYGPTQNPALQASPLPGPTGEIPAVGSYGPSLPQVRPVVLVIGPGLAHAYSAVGVIKRLADEKIPVSAVVGSEMGALIAALYANSNTPNELEWNLMRFKEDAFMAPAIFDLTRIFNKDEPPRALVSLLKKLFLKKEIQSSRLVLRINVLSSTQQRPLLLERGSIQQAVLGAMADEGYFADQSWEDQKIRSALSIQPFPVFEAKALNMGTVIVVDGLSVRPSDVGSDEKNVQYFDRVTRALRDATEQLSAADVIVRPDVSFAGFYDFQKRSQIQYAGYQATDALMPEIRKKVGLLEGAPSETHQP
jgi:NTE family protein